VIVTHNMQQAARVSDRTAFFNIAGAGLPGRGEVVERRLPAVPRPERLLRPALLATSAAVVALIVFPFDYRQALINSLVAALVCLSLVVITGFVGQISVVQLALAGVSGFVLSHLATDHGVAFPFAPLAGAAAATVLGLVTAVSALRARGVSLVVVTLAAAVAIEQFGFDLVDMFGGRPSGLVLGFIGASQAVPEMVFAPILARFADRLGRRIFLVGGPLFSVIGAVMLSMANNPEQIVIARLVEGVGAACFIPTALGTIAAATTHSQRIRANASGAFEAANLAGYAGGFVVGPFAYHWLHQGAFLVLACLYVAASVVCAAWVPHIPPLPV
jgi:branched-chain amino acid transport system permease protein